MKRVAILCSGLDHRKDRGYENSSKNLFLNLNADKSPNYTADLYKGTGAQKVREYRVRSFANQKWVRNLGNRILNDTFVFEYIIFALFYVFYGWFNRRKYDAIYTQEPRVSKTLYQLRFFLIGNPKIVFGMGVMMTAEHYINICDSAQIVNIEHYKEATRNYPDSNKFRLIPNPGSVYKLYDKKNTKEELRKKYSIITSNVLVCVGAINNGIKRMDYVVEEAAKLSENWSLILVGAPQEKNILDRGKKLMGERFIHVFVGPDEIPEIYYMADSTVLASVVEGFPNVVLEATQNGIAPILHDRELNEWAVKDRELLVDMLKTDELSNLINDKSLAWFEEKGLQCKKVYEDNYSWTALRNDYLEIFNI